MKKDDVKKNDLQADNAKDTPKRRKLRRRIIAAVLVVCTLNNIVFYSLKNSEVYAASLVAGGLCVSGDAISALLGAALLAAGIISTNENIENYGELTAEEQSAVTWDIANAQDALLGTLLEEGYFEGSIAEDLVTAALYGIGIDGTSALNAYNEMQDAENQLKLIEPNNSGDDGNKWASIAATAGVLGAIGENIWEAVSSWAKDKYAESTGIELPAELPEGYDSQFGYTGYIVFEHSSGEIFLYSLKNCNWVAQTYNSTRKRILFLGYKQYKINESNEWVLTDEWKTSTWGSFGIGSGETISKILYNSNAITGALDIPANPYQGGQTSEELPDDQLEQKVNEYLEEIGITSRYSEKVHAAAQQDNFYENIETTLDEYDVTTPALIVDANRDSLIDNLTVPVTNALNDALASGDTDIDTDKVRDTVAAGAQDLANEIDVSPGGAQNLPGTPYTPTFGSGNKYAVDGLEDVFPFCIPFDFARCIEIMVAEPEAPYVEFPFVFERWGINEVIVLDMSKFEGVAAISRWIESIMFAYGLVMKTRTLMSW